MTIWVGNRVLCSTLVGLMVLAFIAFVGCGGGAKPPEKTTEGNLPSADNEVDQTMKKQPPQPKEVSIPAAAEQAEAPVSVSPELDPDTWVIKVDGTEIKQAELSRDTRAIMKEQGARSGGKLPPQAEAQMKKAAAQMLVNQAILVKEADRRGVTVSPEEVNKEIDDIKKQAGADKGKPQPWEQMGMTEADFVKVIGVMAKLDKLKTVLASEDTSDASKEEEVRASHILLKIEPNDTAEQKEAKKKKLTDIRAKIVDENADFAQMAKDNSDCPSKEQGGDLNFFTKEKMVAPFSEAAFKMKIGDISDIVETQFGYHLIKVTERRVAQGGGRQGEEKIMKLLTELREKALIETNPDAGLGDLKKM